MASAGWEARAAAALAQQARAGLQPLADGQAPTVDLLARTEQADVVLAEAQQRLGRPAPSLVSAVPVLGRSWDAEREVVDTGRAVLAGVREVAVALPGLRTDGGVDVTALGALAETLGRQAPQARAALTRLEQTETGLTPPVVGRAVDDAAAALAPAVQTLENAATGARLGAGLLGADGPRSVLVVLQNNAELRGAGGYVSTFATGTFEAGRVSLQPFRDVIDVVELPAVARRVPSTPEYHEDYGPFLADTTNWRTWTMSPEVPDVAAVGAEVAGLLLAERPDVVVLLDVPAVAALAGLGGGEVRLTDGRPVEGAELVEALLVDAYAEAGAREVDQEARRAALRAAAGAAATRLLTADSLDVGTAVDTLGRLARGRHLALWSAETAEQEQLVGLGVAGALQPGAGDLLHVSVNNLTGNKLDYFVDRTIRHEVVLGEDVAQVHTRVDLANRAPDGLVPYVQGLLTPGVSSLRIELSLPVAATFGSLDVDGLPARGGVRFGADRGRAFAYATLGQGQDLQVDLRYELPLTDAGYLLEVVPQPLARDADLTVEIDAAPGRRVTAVSGASPRSSGALREGALVERERIEVALADDTPPPGWRQRLSDFWSEPLRLP